MISKSRRERPSRSPPIIPAVERGRKKLRDDPPECRVDFDTVETRLRRSLRRSDEVVTKLFHLTQEEPPRAVNWMIGRANRHPHAMEACAVTAVMQLDGRKAAVFPDGFRQTCKTLQVMVAVDAHLSREGLTDCLDVGGTGLDEREAALGTSTEPFQLVFGCRAVGLALLRRQRRQHEAVPHTARPGRLKQEWRSAVVPPPHLALISDASLGGSGNLTPGQSRSRLRLEDARHR